MHQFRWAHHQSLSSFLQHFGISSWRTLGTGRGRTGGEKGLQQVLDSEAQRLFACAQERFIAAKKKNFTAAANKDIEAAARCYAFFFFF
jgi:hypothetical protein